MIYKPHILYKRISGETERDEYGRIVSVADGGWTEVCGCRCDHSTDVEISTGDGGFFHPQWRVVCEGNRPDVKPGDRIRVTDTKGNIHAEGTACPTKKLNYLPYAEIYIRN